MDPTPKIAAARELFESGYVVVPAEGKRPLVQKPIDFGELRWRLTRNTRLNIAVLLTGQNIAVVDVDDPEDAWVKANEAMTASPMTARSSRGWHAYFRVETDRPGRKLPGTDVRTR